MEKIEKDKLTAGNITALPLFTPSDELAKLKKVDEIDNQVSVTFGDLIIESAAESHIKEIAELWANLASIQQLFEKDRYSFKFEGKDWQSFVRRKLEKKNNLLLVAHNRNSAEVKGFIYLQTITIPSSNLILKAVVEDLYTKPQYRRQNIATYLLNAALSWSKSQSVKHTELITLAKSKDLSMFYTKYLNSCNKNDKESLEVIFVL